MRGLATLKSWARQLKQHALTLYFAARDARTPLLLRLFALAIAAYAFSPVDLVPDFIPVLGWLDDLIVLPLAIALLVRLMPADVMATARQQAVLAADRPVSYGAAAAVVVIWLLAILLAWRMLAG